MRFPRLTAYEQTRFIMAHTVPSYVRGLAAPRPFIERLFASLDIDRGAIRLLDEIRTRHNAGPVYGYTVNGRTLLLFDQTDVRRVLGGSDVLYSLDTDIKQLTLGRFEPQAVLLSRGRLRMIRREFNEAVLNTKGAGQRVAEHAVTVAADEMAAMLAGPLKTGLLRWHDMLRTFDRIGRRIVLGDAARDDTSVTALLYRLRRHANRLFVSRANERRVMVWRSELEDRIARYSDDANPGSLVGMSADQPSDEETDALGQVPHWLLSMDYVGLVTARALALLTTHPRDFARTTEELATADTHHELNSASAVAAQPYLQAAVTEAARLWPPVSHVSRLVTRPVRWGTVLLPPGTPLMVDLQYLARSIDQGTSAHRFTPRQWLDGSLDNDWTILPFSGGKGGCPGAMLSVYIAVAAVSAVLRQCHVRTLSPTWGPDRDLPGSHAPDDIRFAIAERVEQTTVKESETRSRDSME